MDERRDVDPSGEQLAARSGTDRRTRTDRRQSRNRFLELLARRNGLRTDRRQKPESAWRFGWRVLRGRD